MSTEAKQNENVQSQVAPFSPIDEHTKFEDVLAMLMGTFVLSFSLNLLQFSGIMTGGTAGLALLIHYITGLKFGTIFFLINIPFYYFAYKKMGIALVIKTFIAVGLLSLFSEVTPQFFHIKDLNPFYSTIVANILMGVSFLMLFRHRSSLGGINLLALFIQSQYKIAAGKVQMGIDISILAASAFFVGWHVLGVSILGAVILNFIIAMNHKPSRYIA
ncbi:YitT family protein [Acinetobacter nectaris]|uniref:YitT family protein n=1 Tax=Acinetobacter nectaris TaxID=1219382 RepID=UPI001F31BE3C|nr:YitT family protein [Acinetobacter nectaris]MCF8999499.1 YitT family protein [Acinetobacter nectaris]MCF9028027.1 YitT family protein [Acinetobacter nectaris]